MMPRPDDLMTLDEAARRAGRSYAWARDRAADGRFERVTVNGRRILVTERSVARIIEREWPSRAERSRAKPRPVLRLVVDNTK